MTKPNRHRAAASLLVAAGAMLPAPSSAAEPDAPSFWERPTLLGDIGGLRPRLDKAGVTVSLQQTGEAWTNPTGGLKQGTVFDSLVQAGVSLDTGHAGWWQRGTFQLSALAVVGRFPTQDLVGNLQAISNIEAKRGLYLYEAWFEQAFPRATGSLRLGQIRADAEFLTSAYGGSPDYANAGGLFINSSFGFPVLTALALPSGGPAYPLATPGVRLKLTPTERVTLLLGAFNGTPSASAFTFRGRTLMMAEAQLATNQAEDAPRLPGTWRLGLWHHTNAFADQRYDTTGLSLADPLSNGIARRLPSDSGAYAMADQLLIQTGETRAQSIGVFARLMVAPSDRNQVDFYVNGGFTWKGPLPGRPDDALGLGVSWARISPVARGLDRDTAYYTGAPYPLRSNETVIEATYQIALAGWWQIQPDIQYVLRPGGGIPDPRHPGRTLKDALVLGLRSTITF